jgi:LuxR family transcriptional regulator, maltose regulon positive regulatory protein
MLGVEDEVSYLRERDHLVLARVLLAQGKPEQACMLLERLLAAAEAAGRTGSVIEILALQEHWPFGQEARRSGR